MPPSHMGKLSRALHGTFQHQWAWLALHQQSHKLRARGPEENGCVFLSRGRAGLLLQDTGAVGTKTGIARWGRCENGGRGEPLQVAPDKD